MSAAANAMALRKRTGAAVADCRDALAQVGGDIDAAAAWLEARGLTLDARLTAPEAGSPPSPREGGAPWADAAPARVYEHGGVRLFVCTEEGPALRHDADAVDLIVAALGAGATRVVLPATRLGPHVFPLSTRVAGEILQKFANFKMGLAVIGDLSGPMVESRALRDFVYESNRGEIAWFLPDLAALEEKLDRLAR